MANILNDFTFVMGNNNSASHWTTAPSPISVSVRPGVGVGGADRVELVWADNAIKETWLEVIVKPTADTGLAQIPGDPAGYGDVFFFGNAAGDDFVGETTVAFTNSTDDLDVRNHPGAAVPITNIYDYTKDGFVNSSDSIAARTVGSIKFINVGNPPFVPVGSPSATAATRVAEPSAALAVPVVSANPSAWWPPPSPLVAAPARRPAQTPSTIAGRVPNTVAGGREGDLVAAWFSQLEARVDSWLDGDVAAQRLLSGAPAPGWRRWSGR